MSEMRSISSQISSFTEGLNGEKDLITIATLTVGMDQLAKTNFPIPVAIGMVMRLLAVAYKTNMHMTLVDKPENKLVLN